MHPRRSVSVKLLAIAAAALAVVLFCPAADLNAEDGAKDDASNEVKIARISISGPLHDALSADNPFASKAAAIRSAANPFPIPPKPSFIPAFSR